MRVSRDTSAANDALGVKALHNNRVVNGGDAVRLDGLLAEHVNTLEATEDLEALETSGLLLVRRNLTVLGALALDNGSVALEAGNRRNESASANARSEDSSAEWRCTRKLENTARHIVDGAGVVTRPLHDKNCT
jgi:hypothetical protein